jgi:hypothetical protein
MKIGKTFEITLSRKFPDGSIASVKVGSTYETEAIAGEADEEAIDRFARKLSVKVYEKTIADIRRLIKTDKIIKEIHHGFDDVVAASQREREAELEENEVRRKKKRSKS